MLSVAYGMGERIPRASCVSGRMLFLALMPRGSMDELLICR
jgi:hypothetical protein